jgi:hypothetical protein
MFLLFEVMDKEPSLTFVWGIYLILGVSGFFLARKNPLLLLILIPFLLVALLISATVFSELDDPFVGPAIIREAGYGYVIQNYMAMFIGAVLPIAGAIAWALRKRKKTLL